MKMKKIASVVAAGVMAMGIGASLAPAGVAFADSPYCATVEKVAPENGFFFDFAKKMPKEAQASHGWCNGAMFDTNWYKDNVTFNSKRMQLNLDVEDGPGWSIPGINYSGAEFRTFTQNRYHYGLYEVCMKPAKSDGIVSSFFTYTGPYDEPKTQWDEIDIEFLGKDTTKAQFNYFVDSQGGHEYLCDLGFDASEDFHVYAFDWEPDAITWYVDGKEVHKAVGNLPVTPSMVMANLWAGKGVDEWLNPVDDSDFPVQAEYKWMKYTPSEKANK